MPSTHPQLIVFALNSQPVPSYQLKPSRRRKSTPKPIFSIRRGSFVLFSSNHVTKSSISSSQKNYLET